MKHARKDYNRIQDPEGLIGEDEPVFLVRAKDKTAPNTLRSWAKLNLDEGTDEAMINLVLDWANRMEKWQEINGCKVPDLPEGYFNDKPEPLKESGA